MIPTPRTFAPTPVITAVLSTNPLACIFLPVVTIPTKDAFEIDVDISSISEYGLTSEIMEDEIVSIKKTYDLSDSTRLRRETEHMIDLPRELENISAFRIDIDNEQLK